MEQTGHTVTRRLLEVMTKVIASDFEPDIKTQADFSGAIGVHPTALSRMISGNGQATVEHLVTLCSRFKVSGTYLLSGRGDMFLPGSKIDNSAAKIETRLRELASKMDVLIAASHNQTSVTETRNKRQKIHLKRAK